MNVVYNSLAKVPANKLKTQAQTSVIQSIISKIAVYIHWSIFIRKKPLIMLPMTLWTKSFIDIFSLVLVNDWKNDSFSVLSWVRQGCPLSSLPFLLHRDVYHVYLAARSAGSSHQAWSDLISSVCCTWTMWGAHTEGAILEALHLMKYVKHVCGFLGINSFKGTRKLPSKAAAGLLISCLWTATSETALRKKRTKNPLLFPSSHRVFKVENKVLSVF